MIAYSTLCRKGCLDDEVFREVILVLMRRIFWVIAAGFGLLSGIRILSEPACESVSFGRAGGRRVSVVSCYPDSSGALPAGLAGVGLIAVAVLVIFLAFKRPRFVPPASSVNRTSPLPTPPSSRVPPQQPTNSSSDPSRGAETCASCGVPRRDDATFCPSCGTRLSG